VRRVFILIGLALTIAVAAVAQEIIVIPLEEGEETFEDETLATETLAEEVGTLPTEELSEEDLLDLFMTPIAERQIFDAERDGLENLPAPIPDENGISRIAVVRGLDKITALVRDVETPVGVPVMFNSFEILVQTCDRRPPEETPEVTAFVQVTEHRLDDTMEPIFSGWMYASTPSLNAVEHSTYDIWLIDCRTL